MSFDSTLPPINPFLNEGTSARPRRTHTESPQVKKMLDILDERFNAVGLNDWKKALANSPTSIPQKKASEDTEITPTDTPDNSSEGSSNITPLESDDPRTLYATGEQFCREILHKNGPKCDFDSEDLSFNKVFKAFKEEGVLSLEETTSRSFVEENETEAFQNLKTQHSNRILNILQNNLYNLVSEEATRREELLGEEYWEIHDFPSKEKSDLEDANHRTIGRQNELQRKETELPRSVEPKETPYKTFKASQENLKPLGTVEKTQVVILDESQNEDPIPSRPIEKAQFVIGKIFHRVIMPAFNESVRISQDLFWKLAPSSLTQTLLNSFPKTIKQ